MTLSKYIAQLQEIAKVHPDIQLIYSADDEGNSYDRVHFLPSLGHYDDGEWTPEDDRESFEEQGYKVNAACIN